MRRQEMNRRKALSGLLYKNGEITSLKTLNKKELNSLLISVFNKNAEIYDKHQSLLDNVYSMEGEMYRYVMGDTRSEAELIQAGEDEAKQSLRKSLCYLVKWACSAGYYKDPKDMVNSLYKSRKVRHLSAREEWLLENRGAGLFGMLMGCEADNTKEFSAEDEYNMFVNRFMRVTAFTCRLHDFNYLKA